MQGLTSTSQELKGQCAQARSSSRICDLPSLSFPKHATNMVHWILSQYQTLPKIWEHRGFDLGKDRCRLVFSLICSRLSTLRRCNAHQGHCNSCDAYFETTHRIRPTWEQSKITFVTTMELCLLSFLCTTTQVQLSVSSSLNKQYPIMGNLCYKSMHLYCGIYHNAHVTYIPSERDQTQSKLLRLRNVTLF